MGARILVIEDNPANLELMRYLLEAFGHTVISARDGREGLDAARRHQPELIVCDIQMPVMDGLEVAFHLKREPPLSCLPLVAVTALAMVGDRGRLLGAGFNGYIAKPIDPESFVHQVEAFLSSEARTLEAVPSQSQDSPAASASDGPCILVVDDNPVNLDLARSVLEPFGYRVVAASGARQALHIARSTPPDLILSDVCMSEGTGLELVADIRADSHLSEIAVILLTSTYTSEAERANGLACGANQYLIRPIEPEVLLREIAAHLPKKGS